MRGLVDCCLQAQLPSGVSEKTQREQPLDCSRLPIRVLSCLGLAILLRGPARDRNIEQHFTITVPAALFESAYILAQGLLVRFEPSVGLFQGMIARPNRVLLVSIRMKSKKTPESPPACVCAGGPAVEMSCCCSLRSSLPVPFLRCFPQADHGILAGKVVTLRDFRIGQTQHLLSGLPVLLAPVKGRLCKISRRRLSRFRLRVH